MARGSLYRHFFGHSVEIDPEGQFDFSRKSRSRRLREIYGILTKHHVLSGFTPAEFRTVLEELGPSFVKIGQTLSTRSEILPQAYRDELAKLQTECDPLPFDEVKAALDEIFGGDCSTVFQEVDEKPLGSASLAQVHKARLVGGDVVAVKVQRPGVKATMAQDIDIMRIMARRATRFVKGEQMLDFDDVIEEMWTTFLEETDFAREAENLALFSTLNASCAYIDCPKVYPELCSEYCLVMEYVEGTPIYDHEALVAKGYDLREIGEKMIDNYATQVLEHGFFHADPHPGNIIVREGQVVYIDLGIMGRLTATDRAVFGDLIEAVGAQDTGRLKDALLAFAISRDNGSIDHSKMLADMDLLLSGYSSVDVADLDIGLMLADVMALMRSSRVTLPPSVTNVSRGIVTIEGTIADFIPNESIMHIINAHILRSRDPIERAKGELADIALDARKAAVGASQAAAYSGEAMRMLTRGQLKVNMEVLGSDAPMTALSKIMNRLTIGIIIAGLFIGSSMFAQIEGQALVFGVPIISFFGFLGAFILSAWVIIDIWRRK